MQRQTFREETDTTPRYDPETVRQVLARASEIETQAEPGDLTPAQVETLGAKLGIHPDAVRRALGEIVPTRTATVTRPASSSTDAQATNMVVVAFLVAALNAVMYYQILGLPAQPMKDFFLAVSVFAVAPMSTFIYGVMKRDKGQMFIYSTVLNAKNSAFLAVAFHFYHGEHALLNVLLVPFGCGIFLSLLLGAFGVHVGGWSEKRKRRLDR